MNDAVGENVLANRARPCSRQGRELNEGSLYGRSPGDRKYLNAEERGRVMRSAIERLPPDQALFVLTLAWTGARVSEVLALCPSSFQIEAGTVAICTLKRRRPSIREIPFPPDLMSALNAHFGLLSAQRSEGADRPIWVWCRQTAWRITKRVTEEAGVRGRRASPRGFRHAFGVGTLQAGIPLNLVQRWLGHASMTTTAIYAAASGPEEAAFAARFWQSAWPKELHGGIRDT